MDTCVQPMLVSPQRADALKAASLSHASTQLGPRQQCELEMLLSGAFAPLAGYMGREDFESILAGLRLADGRLWPMPLSLDVPEALAGRLGPGDKLALRDQEGFMLAVLTVSEVWPGDPAREAAALFGVPDVNRHPQARAYAGRPPTWHIGGCVEGISLPLHADFPELRRTPAEVRAMFRQRGWRKVLGCQPQAIPHNRQRAMLRQAAAAIEGSILLLRETGDAISGGALHFAGVRCAKLFAEGFPPNMLLVSLLPLCSKQAGPRQALFEALVQKNHGCTHTLIGPNHADPLDADGAPLYAPGAAQRLVADSEAETGIAMVPESAMGYVEEKAQYLPKAAIAPGMTVRDLSPAELKRRLEFDLDIPEWFTPPAVAAELRAVFPPRSRQGLTIFMTGLSGAGKSTLARLLFVKFMELRSRPVSLLDGDIVRRHLSSELTFSKEHRNLNISRIGFVASEITKNGGIAICAPIAPYASSRAEARALVTPHGGFIEVYVSTPLAVCEQRDRKGLYAKARAGIVKGVTGIDDPYEAPQHAEIGLDTTKLSPGEAVQEVLLYLEREGYLS